MINDALNFLCFELNAHFKTALDTAEEKVTISGLCNTDGSQPMNIQDKVVMTLVNIAPNSAYRDVPSFKRTPVDTIAVQTATPLNIDLNVLFSASFNNYIESLKFITSTISFFHSKAVFTRQNSPSLAPNIEKLRVEMEPANLEQNNFLWSMLGCRYIPSVLYRVRMIHQ
jgi:hypothetical protein